MRLLWRILFQGAAAISMLLFLGTCVGWVGSRDGIYFYSQRWVISGSSVTHTERWVFAVGGQFGIAHRETTSVISPLELPSDTYLAAHPEFQWTLTGHQRTTNWDDDAIAAPRTHGVGNFHSNDYRPIPVGNYQERAIPAYWPAAVFALLPLYWLSRLRIRQVLNRKNLFWAHTLASYSFFGVVLLFPEPGGYTPVFWFACALAPLGAPICLLGWTIEFPFGIGVFMMWILYATLLVTFLVAAHYWRKGRLGHFMRPIAPA